MHFKVIFTKIYVPGSLPAGIQKSLFLQARIHPEPLLAVTGCRGPLKKHTKSATSKRHENT